MAATHPNASGIACRHLDRQGFSFYNPQTWGSFRLETGRVVKRKVQMFQDYVFVVCVDRWRDLNSTSGICNVLMSAPEKPAEIPTAFISDLQRREQDGLVVLPRFRRGDRLVVTRGTYAMAECSFDRMDRNDRVMVLLTMLGRQCRVSVREDTLAAA